MQGPITDFWGKLDRSDVATSASPGTARAWHPLEDHIADVAAVTERLLSCTILGVRMAAAVDAEQLTRAQVARLVVLAALHDIGKYNNGFQRKASPSESSTAGHVREAIPLVLGMGGASSDRLAAALDVDRFIAWGDEEEGSTRLLLASIMHHGRPVPVDPPMAFVPALWRPASGRDPLSGIESLAGSLRLWLPEAFTDEGPAFRVTPTLQHALSGVVQLADWIGSDTELFPFSEPGDAPRYEASLARAASAFDAMHLDPRRARAALQSTPATWERAFAFTQPRPTQAAVAGLSATRGGSITILEAPTGEGKTEAALMRFFTLLRAGEVDGLYFALPTRTAASQLYSRVTRVMERLFRAEDRPPVVQAVPGYLSVDGVSGQRTLARFEVLWPDAPDQRFSGGRAWAAVHAKRYLAAAVAVGTVDQALLATLRTGHVHLRSAALSRQLLVVDEVHASDAYMTSLLRRLLHRHVGLGGHAFLMSATLGGEARAALLSPGSSPPRVSLDDARRAPYPLVTHRGGSAPPARTVAAGSRARTVAFELAAHADAPDEVARRALAAARRGASVLVVRNTVGGAHATMEALERAAHEAGARELLFRCNGVVTLHHSRFAREDRQALDGAIEAALGPARPTRGLVAVGTQTVEQSLDLDADLLITDLCPMDVLLQRVGRLHRHVRARPSGFGEARVVVLTPEDRELGGYIDARTGEAWGAHGLGTVYKDLTVLEATWGLLQSNSSCTLPTDARRLVEDAVHSDVARVIVERLGPPWDRHHQSIRGDAFASRGHASLVCMAWEADIDSPEVRFDDRHALATTRLGEEDRLFCLSDAVPGPLGVPVRNFKLPHFWARELPAELPPPSIETHESHIVIDLGLRRLRYDRFGLTREEIV